jgi:uncharacterized protein (TIGR00730 family)
MAARDWGLVYGGGHIGLMGVLADAVLAGGGRVCGVIPRFLEAKELAHRGVQELLVVESMHERKALMAERADAFLALPGGFGTADELFEILTWRQLGLHDKPIAIWNVAGFFDPLIAWLERMVEEEYLSRASRGLLFVEHDLETLLNQVSKNMPKMGSR